MLLLSLSLDLNAGLLQDLNAGHHHTKGNEHQKDHKKTHEHRKKHRHHEEQNKGKKHEKRQDQDDE